LIWRSDPASGSASSHSLGSRHQGIQLVGLGVEQLERRLPWYAHAQQGDGDDVITGEAVSNLGAIATTAKRSK
jgi:hypothetical protein